MLHDGDGLYSRGFSLLGMTVTLKANRCELLSDDEYFLGKGARLHSLLSNFCKLKEIPPEAGSDLTFSLIDSPASPFGFSQSAQGKYLITGPIMDYESASKNKRACIFGNMGLFSKILVRELECKGVYSIHSTSFYDRKNNRLYIVMGGSGSGKSTVLLKAISLGGIEVFGTELTHFSITGGRTKMHKGSLWQNCRMGNLVFDFPELLPRFGLQTPAGDPWHTYESVSLMDMQVGEDDFDSVPLVLVMPRIEGERRNASVRPVPATSVLGALFQNLSDKVSPPTLLWGKYFVPSIDTPERQTARMEAARNFLGEAPIVGCRSVLSSPQTCLNGIFPLENIDGYLDSQEGQDE